MKRTTVKNLLFGSMIPDFAIEIFLGLPRRARLNPCGFKRSALRANFAIAKFGIISILLMGCAPLDDVSFARTTLELLINGRYSARSRLDWPVLKIMAADIGQEYSKFKTSQDRESYEQSFIKSFSEGYKKAGAKASAFFGWRAFSDYKTKDPNMTVVAAYAHDRTTNLLFVISREGRAKKIVEILAVRRLGNAEVSKNQ